MSVPQRNTSSEVTGYISGHTLVLSGSEAEQILLLEDSHTKPR